MPGPLPPVCWESGTLAAPDSGNVFPMDWDQSPINPGRVAGAILSQIYEWYGIEHDKIPYAIKEDGYYAISPDEIKRIHPC